MDKIDAHHHVWKYHPESHGWIDENMAVLQRDYLPGELLHHLNEKGYQGSVVVQASQTESETDFLLDQAAKYPFIRGVVGWLDLRASDIEQKLKRYSNYSELKGLRHVVQDEQDDQFLLRDDFLHGISLLSSYNFTYDILIFSEHLGITVDFVKRFPNQKFVLDHIAKPDIKNGSISPWKEGIIDLASCSNVYCKLSGMVTEASWDSWKYDDFVPYLDVVVNTFGTDRLMIGSDWPVCTLAGSYAKVIDIVENYFEEFDPGIRNKVFRQNAIDFYSL